MSTISSKDKSPEDDRLLEQAVEYSIYASRWLLVPIFVGLFTLLLALIIKFYLEVVSIFSSLLVIDKVELILKTLNMVDLALIASLLVMVAISGYENFVSRLEGAENNYKPSFFSKIDPGTIKIKLSLSIVAISSINLLQIFLSLDKYTDAQIMWKAIIHVVFIASALAIALIDNMQKKLGRNK